MNDLDKEFFGTANQLKESGYQAFQEKDFQKSRIFWLQGVQMIEQMEAPDLHLKGKLLFNIGLTCSHIGDDDEAILYYKKAIDLEVPQEKSCFLGKAYMGMGQSFRKLNDFEKAVASMEQAVAIFQRQGDLLMAERSRVNCEILYGEIRRIEEL
jgi:HTH-type transcriptional regulator, quorum sensing regulator NprR